MYGENCSWDHQISGSPLYEMYSILTDNHLTYNFQLTVKSNLKVEVSCYNDKAGSWEPLLEPVECDSGYKPYDLCVEVGILLL